MSNGGQTSKVQESRQSENINHHPDIRHTKCHKKVTNKGLQQGSEVGDSYLAGQTGNVKLKK